MPNVFVDPFGSGLFRILLRINPCFFQALEEDRVLEAQIASAMVMVEGVVAVEHIIVPPSQLPGVGGEHHGFVTILVRSLQHGDDLLVIRAHVELEEAKAAAIGFRYILDAVASGGRERVSQTKFLSYFGNAQLASGMVDVVDANWCESDRSIHSMSEDSCSCVTIVGVNQSTGDDLMAVECCAICIVRPRLTSIARRVVPVKDQQKDKLPIISET